jgi:hypothetical protein
MALSQRDTRDDEHHGNQVEQAASLSVKQRAYRHGTHTF